MERLLREAEHRVELALHIVRGLFWAALIPLGVAAAKSEGLIQRFGLTLLPIGVVTVVAYFAVLRLLRSERYYPRLKYILIVADAMLVGRVFLAKKVGVFDALGMTSLPFTDQEITAMAPMYFALVAFSGGARFSVRVAAWSTVVALAVYQLMALTFPISTKQWIAQSVLILLAGAMGIGAARGLRSLVERAVRSGVMERYVPEALVAEIAKAEDVAQMGRQEEVSVLFADIRGFTRRSETMTPQESVQLLNAYFGAVVAAIASQQGVTDKYIGDGVLAFFEGPDHAARALRAAEGMLRGIDEFNATHPDEPPLRIGVAVNSGEALVGTVGAPSRKEYTVIGDVVNVAARLEELNKKLAASCTIAAHTFAAARASSPISPSAGDGFQGPTVVPIRGHEGDLSVYYLPDPTALLQPPPLAPPEAPRQPLPHATPA